MSASHSLSGLRLGLVAGEASGDLLGSLLLENLPQRLGMPVNACGIGGAKMRAKGMQTWWACDRLAVHGYTEALWRLPELLSIRRGLISQFLVQNKAQRLDLFMGIDAPDFNLFVERQLKRAGVPVLHWVSPSVWAWRAGRIPVIGRSTDHVLCVFPFEPALYARHGIPATYVGHPLAQCIPMTPDRRAARQALKLPDDVPVVAVLPGSREGEIQRHTPLFAQAMQLLARDEPHMHFVWPTLPSLRAKVMKGLQQVLGTDAWTRGHVHVLDGQSHVALAACDVSLLASGTATLEAALFKRPMVIAYQVGRLSWEMMRRMHYQPWIGLPNILAGEFLVPEFMQKAATPKNLSTALQDWLHHPDKVSQLQRQFEVIHRQLQKDTFGEISQVIQQAVRSR